MDDQPEIKSATHELPTRWKLFGPIAPLLLDCIQPLIDTAPELLDAQPVVNGILAVYMVNAKRFRMTKFVLPKHYTPEEIVVIWGKMQKIWKFSSGEALHYNRVEGTDKQSFTSTRVHTWPIIETALRFTVPSLPAELDIGRDFNAAMMHDPKIRSFLFCITLLVSVVTRRERRLAK